MHAWYPMHAGAIATLPRRTLPADRCTCGFVLACVGQTGVSGKWWSVRVRMHRWDPSPDSGPGPNHLRAHSVAIPSPKPEPEPDHTRSHPSPDPTVELLPRGLRRLRRSVQLGNWQDYHHHFARSLFRPLYPVLRPAVQRRLQGLYDRHVLRHALLPVIRRGPQDPALRLVGETRRAWCRIWCGRQCALKDEPGEHRW